MKPTRQQIDNARMYFERLLCLGVFATEDKEHLRTLLAATEPATDAAIALEAAAWARRANKCDNQNLRAAFRAGWRACEGRR